MGLVTMPDRRTVLRAILLGSAGIAVPSGLAALGGCGVPTGGRPEVDGPGPSAGIAGLTGGGTPDGPDTAISPEDLVAKYLRAVAGKLDDSSRESLQKFARTFMTSEAAQNWTPGADITVVRVGDLGRREGGTSTNVDVTLRPVGQLSANGMLKPIDLEAVRCTFEVVNDRLSNQGNDAWRIQRIQPVSLANVMLLDSAALDDPRLFTPQLVYYWSSGGGRSALVPDLRYLPLVGTDQNRYARIVTDLLSLPSSWLAVTLFPNPTALTQATTDDKGYLSVNIKLPTPDAIDHNRLMTQLRASLYPLYTRTLQLQINSQKQQSSGGDGYRTANLADSPARKGADPYCVAGGVVRPLHEDARPPAVLDAPLNRDVVWAALSRDKRMVAVVRQAAGHYGLWIGDEAAGPGYIACTKGFPRSATRYGRPAWLPGQPAGQERILVLVDDQLYAVDRASVSASNITPAGVQHVQAFSVAPDGRRIALIADGVPEIAALTPTEQSTLIGTPQPINVPDLVRGTFAAVAWSRLERVVVAGRLSGSTETFSIFEATIDGAIIQQFRNADSKEQISHLAAYPPGPVEQPAGMGWVLGQAGSGKSVYSFQIEGGRYDRLNQLQIQPSASPSASASASPKPVELMPTAPFFAD